VVQHFVDKLMAGQCQEAIDNDTSIATRNQLGASALQFCASVANDPLTSFKITGVTNIDTDHARVDQFAALRSGKTDQSPIYTIRENTVWKVDLVRGSGSASPSPSK
jgi:hypothetical protein